MNKELFKYENNKLFKSLIRKIILTLITISFIVCIFKYLDVKTVGLTNENHIYIY